MKKAIITITLGCTMLLSMGNLSAQGRKYKSGLDTQTVLSIAQNLYKEQYGTYASNLSVLLQFLDKATFPRVIMSRELTDKELENCLTRSKAIRAGLIKADTVIVDAKKELLGEGQDVNIIRFDPQVNKLFAAASKPLNCPPPPPPPSSAPAKQVTIEKTYKTPVILYKPIYRSKSYPSFELIAIERWANATVVSVKFFQYQNIDMLSINNAFTLTDQRGLKYTAQYVINAPYHPKTIQLHQVRGEELYFQIVFPGLATTDLLDLNWKVPNGGLDFYGIQVSQLFEKPFEQLPNLPQSALESVKMYRSALTKKLPLNRISTDYEFHDGMLAVYRPELSGYGFIDEQGNIRTKFEWKYTQFGKPRFGAGHCLVAKIEEDIYRNRIYHWYIIDKNGEIKVELGKDIEVKSGFNEDGYAIVVKGNRQKGYRCMVIDVNGREVFPNLSHSGSLRSLDLELYPFTDGLAMFGVSHRYGYIDRNGRIVIPAQYEYARPFSEGLAAVEFPGTEGGTPSLWGYIDTNGKTVIPPTFSAQPGDFSEGLAIVTKRSKKQTVIDRNGKVADREWDSLTPFHLGHSIANGLFVVDRNLNILQGPFLFGNTKVKSEVYKQQLSPCMTWEKRLIFPNGYLYPIKNVDNVSDKLIHYHDSWNHIDGFINIHGHLVFEFTESEF